MNKRHYEHTLPNIRGSLSNTYISTTTPNAVLPMISLLPGKGRNENPDGHRNRQP